MAIGNGKYLIYRHIRPDKDEPFYIGIAKDNHGRQYDKRKRNDIWNNIIQKNNGVYEVEVLCEDLTLEEASQKEIEFIALYGRIKYETGILANILEGGADNRDYRKLTEEEKENLRQKNRGPNPKKSFIKSAKERERLSIMCKNRIGPNTGGTMTQEGKKRHIARMTGNHYVKDSGKLIGNKYSVGRMYITDGISNQFIMNTDTIPDGWRKGMAPKVYKNPSKKGRPMKVINSHILDSQ